MSKRFSTILVLLYLLLSTDGCRKIEGPAGDIFKTWEVKEFVASESSYYKHDENTSIFITINEDLTYSLQFETNTCKGTILYISDLSLIMEPAACTEMCCDSPFASRFEGLIPYISMYKVTGITLRLYIKNWGFIECQSVEYQADPEV